MQDEKANITSLLSEKRSFEPPKWLKASAHIHSQDAYQSQWDTACSDPRRFWEAQAHEHLSWFSPWTQVLQTDFEDARFSWFSGATLNASYNCLDRHLPHRSNKPAIIWEGESGEQRTLSYADLHSEVCKLAAVLDSQLSIKPGELVSLYMPMLPELVIAVLACARIGAIHNVVFGGFSSEALAARNRDSQTRLIITADGAFRRGKVLPLKNIVDQSLQSSPSVTSVLVVARTGQAITMQKGRDFWWHESMAEAGHFSQARALDAEHPLFLLYTSGSTGTPKGLVHTTGGYLLGVCMTTKYVFDLQEDDIYWCTADIGWITGHSYVVYGPLANGATVLLYEGAPDIPDWGRFWSLIAKHRVTKFYTAPTAIRSFMRYGPDEPKKYDLSSLKILGSVGEPINPEAWLWYYEQIGQKRCAVIDTWWQTETGAIMLTSLPGVHDTKPGSAGRPLWGCVPKIVDDRGQALGKNQGGYLVLSQPWPSMARTIHGDHQRYKEQYWQKIPGHYLSGDGARCDEDGDFWILGRIDDVVNVAGHRLSTMEIESALASHPLVTEAAVVSKTDPIKGEAIVAFVTLRAGGDAEPEAFKKILSDHVASQIGSIARPAELHFTDALPKTRSGKIMRRLLRNLATGTPHHGDTSTLENHGVLDILQEDLS